MSGYEELIGRLRGAASAEIHCAHKADNDATGFYSIRSNGQAYRNLAQLHTDAATALEAAQRRIKKLEDEKQRRIDDEYRRNPFA